jgi:uncharacterized protein YndB with AHSA1/START domain
MAAYFTSQGYDAPAALIWPILTDFPSWPRWFPNVTAVRIEDAAPPGPGARLFAVGDDTGVWTRWQIIEWSEPALLVCEHIDSNAPASAQVQTAFLQFQLVDEPEGCTLEVEVRAEGYGIMGDFFVGVSLGAGVRRWLPRLVDAFTAYVIDRVRSAP